MKKQNIALSIILALAFMMILPMMTAATLTSPVTNGNYTKSMAVTVSVGAAPAITNVTCYYNASGGAATTKFLQILNTTAAQTSFTGNAAFTTESSTYNVSCKVLNKTTLNSTKYARAITIDGTNPTNSISTDLDQISVKRPIVLTWASSDTNLYTTAVTLTSPDTTNCPTLTSSASSGTTTYQDEQVACAGTWTATIVSTDYSGNTQTATDTFRVTNPDGKFIGEKSLKSIGSDSNNSTLIIVVIIIIILVVFFKKK